MKIYAPVVEFMHENVRTKIIDGTNNMYAVREDGVVLSLRFGKQKVLAQSYSDKGYKKINIKYGDKVYTKRVHRLVAEAFIVNEEPDLYNQIDHIDNIKDNNNYTNLRWCSCKINIHYRFKDECGKAWEPAVRRTACEIAEHKDYMAKKKQDKIDNMPFGSIDELIKQKGKPVVINSIAYRSATEAARYICSIEHKNINTVSKEIRKMIGGKRKFGTMYSAYKITPLRT